MLDVDVYLVDAADYYDEDAMKHKEEHEKKMIQLCKELYRKMSDSQYTEKIEIFQKKIWN